jgi:hypothetical protein
MTELRDKMCDLRNRAAAYCPPVVPKVDALIASYDEATTAPQWPAWRQAIPLDGAFHPIAGTERLSGASLLTNQPTMPGSAISDWCGFCAHPYDTRLVSAAAGGHFDWQNGVMLVDLKDDAPRWQMRDPGTPYEWLQAFPGGAQVCGTPVDGECYYPASLASAQAGLRDGLPCSRHTYMSAVLLPSLDRAMLVTAYAVFGSVGRTAQVDTFDLTANRWDAKGTWAKPAHGDSTKFPATCLDPATNTVYHLTYTTGPGLQLHTLDAQARTWSTQKITGIPDAQSRIYFKGTCFDVSRNRIVAISSGNFLVLIDPATGAASAYPLSHPLVLTTATFAGSYSQTVHDEDNDHYLHMTKAHLWSIDPESKALALLRDDVLPALNGVNQRMHWLRALGCVVYQPTFASPMLALATRAN